MKKRGYIIFGPPGPGTQSFGWQHFDARDLNLSEIRKQFAECIKNSTPWRTPIIATTAKDLAAEIAEDNLSEEEKSNDCGGCETCDQHYAGAPWRGTQKDINDGSGVLTPDRIKVTINGKDILGTPASIDEPHKCHCPAENFSANGIGCQCGGT